MVGFIESLTRYLEDTRAYSRHKSTAVIVLLIAILGSISELGYNHLSAYQLFDKDINAVMDYVSNQWLLPLGGLLIAVFAGWFVPRKLLMEELNMGQGLGFKVWYGLIRYLVPVAVFVVFIMGVTE